MPFQIQQTSKLLSVKKSYTQLTSDAYQIFQIRTDRLECYWKQDRFVVSQVNSTVESALSFLCQTSNRSIAYLPLFKADVYLRCPSSAAIDFDETSSPHFKCPLPQRPSPVQYFPPSQCLGNRSRNPFVFNATNNGSCYVTRNVDNVVTPALDWFVPLLWQVTANMRTLCVHVLFSCKYLRFGILKRFFLYHGRLPWRIYIMWWP